MEVWPALDLYDGRLVRLVQGSYQDITTYADDALEWVGQLPGILPRLHLVDLEGARTGAFMAWKHLETLAKQGSRVEVGGGLRTLDQVARAFESGADRVILGTRLLTDATFRSQILSHYTPDTIVASIDVKDGMTQTHGWQASGSDAVARWRALEEEGLRLANVTDVGGDGTLRGLDHAFWRRWAEMPGDIGAGGGIRDSQDLEELESMGIHRAVVGKAWLEGSIPWEVISC